VGQRLSKIRQAIRVGQGWSVERKQRVTAGGPAAGYTPALRSSCHATTPSSSWIIMRTLVDVGVVLEPRVSPHSLWKCLSETYDE
jgi:hypothetical protein